MKKLISICLIACIAFFQSGCATIVSGKEQDVNIRSNPPGANVLIDGMAVGKTPLTTDVKRKKRHQITVQKDGYMEETRATKRGFNWWYMGNIIFGGIIGLIVDPCTGAMYKVDPDEINVTLTQLSGAAKPVEATGSAVPAVVSTTSVETQIAQIEALSKLKEKNLITSEEFDAKKKEILR